MARRFRGSREQHYRKTSPAALLAFLVLRSDRNAGSTRRAAKSRYTPQRWLYSNRCAELHWYEATGIGRREMKIKTFI